MFLRAKSRVKDGKLHRYWSIVENCRTIDDKIVQRHVLYLGEINDSQHAAWCKTIDVFQGKHKRQIALFPEDRLAPPLDCEVVQIRLDALTLHHPRQWGACWLACHLWQILKLDEFWKPRLATVRKQTDWLNVLKTIVCYRLISPGSEWRLHRQWYQASAMGDLVGEDPNVIQKDKLYRCLDKLLAHKKELFSHLMSRWKALFNARFDVLLYDLTSTYFECDPPGAGLRQFGYSRDKRSDCVQVVIALIVTPDGFPLAYEVMSGNTNDKSTLADFLKAIEQQYGVANRTWVMDRGIPTEETLQAMRGHDHPIQYLVGAPKGRLTRLEKDLLAKPWHQVRAEVRVKLLAQKGELYVMARSDGRVDKERAMRRRRLKRLWNRLHELQKQNITRDVLLQKIGAAKKDAGRTATLIKINLPKEGEAVSPETFSFALQKSRLRIARRREGCYLLRSNMADQDPAKLWEHYIQLTEVEQAFKELKGDLSVRPIYHQVDPRIEAHIFVAFLAYCLQITLKNMAKGKAPGLTSRSILEKFAAMQMIDVHLPTTDGRTVVLSRYTQPNNDQRILLQKLRLSLPAQPPPKISVPDLSTARREPVCSADL
jgi:transposase